MTGKKKVKLIINYREHLCRWAGRCVFANWPISSNLILSTMNVISQLTQTLNLPPKLPTTYYNYSKDTQHVGTTKTVNSPEKHFNCVESLLANLGETKRFAAACNSAARQRTLGRKKTERNIEKKRNRHIQMIQTMWGHAMVWQKQQQRRMKVADDDELRGLKIFRKWKKLRVGWARNGPAHINRRSTPKL